MVLVRLQHFAFAALMVLLVPGLLAFVFGWFAFRSRVTGVYLSIITQAMTYALLLAFFRNEMGFGGNNGLTDFKEILGIQVQADGTRAALFAATAIMLALCLLLCSAIVRSKYGKVLVGVRDAESRTRFLGYRVENMKLFIFVVSAMMAGVAGALYVPQVGIINPGEFEPGQLDRSRHLDRGRRARHADRADHRRHPRQCRQEHSSPAPSRNSGCSRSAPCSSLVTLFLPKGIVGTVQQFLARRKEYVAPPLPRKRPRMARCQRITEPGAAE